MEEDSDRSGGPVFAEASSVFSSGGRLRFSVELNPDKTNFVSWKKFLKDAAKSQEANASSFQVSSNTHPALEARMAPGGQREKTDAPPANHRFSAVIEKIERLYMGQHSSDEEDMNDVPDDDEYDTEDSFIDDEELDDYFQVDNSAIKHDGFFVNRGKLERIEPPSLPSRESPSLPNQSPKKRKRKDLTKSQTEADKCGLPSKPPKVRKKVAENSLDLVATDISRLAFRAQSSASCNDVTKQNEIPSSQSSSRKKFAATTTPMLNKSVSTKLPNCDFGVSLPEKKKDVFKKMGNVTHRHQNNKLKDKKLTTSVNDLDQSSRKKGKDGFREPANICVSEIKHPMQTVNGPFPQKEASGTKPKISMLDKAIKDLEKLVQESAKLSPVEVRDADNVSQAVKRRLPCEVKQKLAKVAKLAQIIHGKISKELLDRLMSILGHLVQLRTLKRNLNVMVNSGLSAKKEREERIHQIKKEIADIIELQIPYMMKPEALEHQVGSSDDFQETGNLETEAMQKKYYMNDVLEDKLCDLYDLFIEGIELDEDLGPQARKLYMELARLWPEGCMDNHGIKRAICRAKARQRALHSEHKESIKKKLVRKSAAEKGVKLEVKPVVQSQSGQRKLAPAQLSRPILNGANTSSQMLITSPSLDLTKQDKIKGDSVNVSDAIRITDPTVKKKVKRKQPLVPGEAQYIVKKTSSSSSSSFINGGETHKSKKQHLADAPQKPTIKPPPPIAATSRTIYELPPNLSNS